MVADRCPQIKECAAKVDAGIFEMICSTEGWVDCKHLSYKYLQLIPKRVPKDWEVILETKNPSRRNRNGDQGFRKN